MKISGKIFAPGIKRRFAIGSLSLIIALGIWLPCVHLLFQEHLSEWHQKDALSPKAVDLAQRHLILWSDPSLRQIEIDKMRQSNAEWDFMSRTFFVLSLGNMALRNPERKGIYLDIMDRIIEETLKIEKEHGHFYFLMDYAQESEFVIQPPRSLFIDGEIILMAAARRFIEEKEIYRLLMEQRIPLMIAQMKKSPVLMAESYPNECWMFCNTVALASIKMGDTLDKTDHSDFLQEWIASAKKHLIHKKSGLLVSTCTVEGQSMEGPEGSTIWTASHFMSIIDKNFALEQYLKAKKELGCRVLGFGWAKEWPDSWIGKMDIDSGPIVPLLNASAGSSGQALMAAATFEDVEFLSALNTSLNFAAFPLHDEKGLRYCASNQVGDAVLLYSLTLGPLWSEVEKRGRL
jgi:hypothetical protein